MGYIATAMAEDVLKGYVGNDKGASAPTNFYVGVSSTAPTMTDGVIGNVTEPSNGSYARVTVANTTTNWTVSGRTVTNAAGIEFPEATADWDVDPAHLVVFDAATNGNVLWCGALDRTYTVLTGVTLIIDAASTTLTVPE